MLHPFAPQKSLFILIPKFLAPICLESRRFPEVGILKALLKGGEHFLPLLILDGDRPCPIAEDVDDRHNEFMPTVITTQGLHVRQMGLPLSIDPLDLGGVAFEVTSWWFVEGVTLLIGEELPHPAACDLLDPCFLCAAQELLQPSIGPRIFGVVG